MVSLQEPVRDPAVEGFGVCPALPVEVPAAPVTALRVVRRSALWKRRARHGGKVFTLRAPGGAAGLSWWRRAGRGGGFTLLESLMATAVLGISVVALTSALGAGQRASIEGQRQVIGAMVAQDLLSELLTLPYAQLSSRHGLRQEVGDLRTLDGDVYPATFWGVGRRVSVSQRTATMSSPAVSVRGMVVEVTAFDDRRDIATVSEFVPEPGS